MAWNSAYKVIYIFTYSIHVRQIENYSDVSVHSILRIIVSIVSQLIKLPIYNFVFRLGTFYGLKKIYWIFDNDTPFRERQQQTDLRCYDS